MATENNKEGSIWTKWDLHLHAPGTKLSDNYGGGSEENLEKFVRILEDSEVQVFGITDYFSFDGYLSVIELYNRIFPDGKKLFIPNIEFRLTETVSSNGKNVHSHVLIDPDKAKDVKLERILSDLQTFKTRDGTRLRCSELDSVGEFEQATVSITDIQNVLSNVFPDSTAYMILMAANNDGLRGADSKSRRSLSISDELDKASDAFFGVAKNTYYFLKTDRYEDGTPSEKKPVFTGSDAHSFSDLNRLTGDETDFDSTWIKADHSFRGLRQTLFEPQGRVHIGESPTILQRIEQDATRFISELVVNPLPSYKGQNGSWFQNVNIPFNPELTAIIGNKGSGKSAIADIIGLLGESRQHKHFSFLTDDPRNRKFRQRGYAENFTASLRWANNSVRTKNLSEEVDEVKPEYVKYLPQNYFESLTNEIEVKAFREEIEEVVFSHVDEPDRMGKSSFSELEKLKTAQSKSDIATFKLRLHELNIEIIDLEKKADPQTKTSLEEELKQKREEYQALEKSKPAQISKPSEETSTQKAESERIESTRLLQQEIEKRGKNAVETLSMYKSDLVRLGSLEESLSGLDSFVKERKEELRLECTHFNLDIDNIFSHKINIDSVKQKAGFLKTQIASLEKPSGMTISEKTDFNDLSNVSDLRNAHRFLTEEIKTLQEALSAPQRRYQRYIQTLADITSKMADLMGEEEHPKPGTIRDLEQRIRYIEHDLQNALFRLYESRNDICRYIFSAKEHVKEFYEGLKNSVEERLETVSSEDFEVTIDASFMLSADFSTQFFSLINQNARGPFRGSVEGQTKLGALIDDVDWNNIESILKFANKIINEIKDQEISKQVKDISTLYDLLFSLDYLDSRYELRLDGKNLNQLSPGEKGLLLLVFYLHLDNEKTPLIIDQPEDNLDNDSIFSVLAKCIREAKKTRQVILITHNPNLAVGADAEQIVYVTLDKASGYKFTYESGSIENPNINNAIVKVLEGSKPAFVQRRLKYQI